MDTAKAILISFAVLALCMGVYAFFEHQSPKGDYPHCEAEVLGDLRVLPLGDGVREREYWRKASLKGSREACDLVGGNAPAALGIAAKLSVAEVRRLALVERELWQELRSEAIAEVEEWQEAELERLRRLEAVREAGH